MNLCVAPMFSASPDTAQGTTTDENMTGPAPEHNFELLHEDQMGPVVISSVCFPMTKSHLQQIVWPIGGKQDHFRKVIQMTPEWFRNEP